MTLDYGRFLEINDVDPNTAGSLSKKYSGKGDTGTTTSDPPKRFDGDYQDFSSSSVVEQGQLSGIPGDHEFWRIGEGIWAVWTVPSSDPPIYMAWSISTSQYEAIFGVGKRPSIKRTISWDDANSLGLLTHGSVTNIHNDAEHPLETFLRDFEREATIRPWLMDPEMLAITTAALIEGRAVTEAEFKTTNWWRTHTDAERQWLSLNASDPATALTVVEDRRRAVRDAMISLGIDDPTPEIISFVADKITTGQWTENHGTDQVRKLSDPYAPGVLDAELKTLAEGIGLDTTRAEEGTVRDKLALWLGPVHGERSQDWINQWAGALRNDPDAELNLTQALQNQRLALFPKYENPNLTYEDIAAPVRSQFQRVWGVEAEEDDPFFFRQMSNDNIAEREAELRLEGLNRNVDRVANQFQVDVMRAFGGQVRRAL